jgi:hypothetical protein
MNTRKWFKNMSYLVILGWVPYIFVCGMGLRLEVAYRLPIVFIGIAFCFVGSFMLMGLIKNEDLFKSIEDLDKERHKYMRATERLNKKIKEL